MIYNSDENKFVVLPCSKVEQPIGTFYSSSLPWRIIKEVAYSFPRIFTGYDEAGGEVYVGIQREISPERKKDIRKYVQGIDATFPTAVILNIPAEKVLTVPVSNTFLLNLDIYDKTGVDKDFKSLFDNRIQVEQEQVVLVFPYKSGIAQIIDGQHRMSGLEDKPEDFIFDLPVTFFVDQALPDQAEIFSIINGKQTRVTPSLVFDLFGISTARGPYTVARDTVKALNENEESPLRSSIRILGKSSENYTGFVTQSTISKIIIDLICGNARQADDDTRRLKKGEDVTFPILNIMEQPVLRSYFAAKKDEIIYKVILNFFLAVRNVYSTEWNKKESVLKKTVGFTALTKLMKILIKKGIEEKTLSQEFFIKQLNAAGNIDFSDIQLSSKGVKQLLDRLTS